MHCGVPTASFAPFRASEAPPVYQPCPSPLSVPQKPLPCTNRVPHPFPYRRSPSRVPTMPLIPFRTAEAPPVYQPCPSPRSVPQKPLPCTNRVPPSRSVPQKPLPCTNRAPHPVPYRRSPSRVPTVPLTPFRTSEAPPVYQPCPPSRSVPQKPLPCTNYAPHLICAENQPYLNRTLLTILGEWQSFVFVCA